MTADLLALLESDPAAGILAVAYLREQRVRRVASGPYRVAPAGSSGRLSVWDVNGYFVAETPGTPYAEHIAAEANPAHALAAVRRWRGDVERHVLAGPKPNSWTGQPDHCDYDDRRWPCPDLTETIDEARAYLGDAS